MVLKGCRNHGDLDDQKSNQITVQNPSPPAPRPLKEQGKQAQRMWDNRQGFSQCFLEIANRIQKMLINYMFWLLKAPS